MMVNYHHASLTTDHHSLSQVDRARLLVLCERTVSLTAGWTVSQLEELHDRLLSVVRRYAFRRQRKLMLKVRARLGFLKAGMGWEGDVWMARWL